MANLLTRLFIAAAVLATGGQAAAQSVTPEQQNCVQQVVEKFLPAHMGIGVLKAREVKVDANTIVVNLSENFGDVPFTRESLETLKGDIRQAMGATYNKHKVKLLIDGNDIEKYFSSYDKAYKRSHAPFISVNDPNRHYKSALDGNIIALWPSHGWYFEPKLNRWEWQRARLFQTVEDMYTHSYVLPFLVPMLENAGAYVWDARERDTHNIGAVVDNDGMHAQNGYSEANGKNQWTAGTTAGFGYDSPTYKDFENPFANGTYRQATAIKDKKNISTAHWDVDMPQAGNYALYISYKTLPNSVKDAHYTVKSLNGEQEFVVDQTMAGGVWVYIGTFELKKGMNKDVVTLSNYSAKGGVVTADAIRVGGGKGNIVRRVALPTEENKQIAKEQEDEEYLGKDGVTYNYVGSGEHPWFHLGSRYYLQWAGFPKEVYSTSRGLNDYTDDYRSRGEWVNYLAGGSQVLPKRKGLNVPVDLSFCLHTDAGSTPNDSIIGTLLIYSTAKDGKKFGNYENGTPRILSREYADLLSTELMNDIRAKYEPNWTRRGLWDKSYYEARVPEVPAVLMEFLSHDNMADMKYGLDPNFRFDVCRAIYKGMLKFIAQRDHREYMVQPLAVNSFAIAEASAGTYNLTWKPTKDELCDNADANKYVVCERIGNGGFREIAVVTEPHYTVKVSDNEVHSYRIIAMNDGGRSFPSETLSLGLAPNSKGTVMVVNGFTRLSSPDWMPNGEYTGFLDSKDHGVDYQEQINYVGSMYEFRRSIEWRDDDASGFGSSRSDHETEVVAGNTFDYTTVHGKSILKAGYSFVSSSVKAVEDNAASLNNYKLVDLILGKQKEVKNGRGVMPNRFKAFTPQLIDALTACTQQGTSVFVSGSYVASDIWDGVSAPKQSDKDFVEKILGYTYMDCQATVKGEAHSVTTVNNPDAMPVDVQYSFRTKINRFMYSVESPDGIKASDDKGSTWLRYSDNNIPAGIVSDRGAYRTVVMGFPFETVMSGNKRDAMMNSVLQFLSSK